MINARLMRYLWIPIVVLSAIGLFVVRDSTHSMAQDAGDCRPNNINTSNWSTDFCNGDLDFGEVLSGGPAKDGIRSLENPSMESIDDASKWLVDRSPVIAVEIEGEARAYPQAILMWHEIANDEIAGVPIAVTFCPLCNSSITYDRRVGDAVLDFGVSGLLRNSDMIMFDRQTDSWWQQLTGIGLVGEYAGTLLDFVPSQVISFGQFTERYPEGVVMSTDTGLGRTYGRNPYVGYDSSPNPFLFRDKIDDRLESAVTHVLATDINDTPKAYPFELIQEMGVINDSIGETSLVIFYQSGVASALGDSVIDNGRDIGTAGMYDATVNDQLLTFVSNGDGSFTDEQTSSTWNAYGEAIDGDLEGTELDWIHAFPHFWFAWAAFHPETEIYGI